MLKEFYSVQGHWLYKKIVDTMRAVVELVVLEVELSSLDITYAKLVFTVSVGFHFRLKYVSGLAPAWPK